MMNRERERGDGVKDEEVQEGKRMSLKKCRGGVGGRGFSRAVAPQLISGRTLFFLYGWGFMAFLGPRLFVKFLAMTRVIRNYECTFEFSLNCHIF